MENNSCAACDAFDLMGFSQKRLMKLHSKITRASLNMAASTWLLWKGLLQYTADFAAPSWNAAKYFTQMETARRNGDSPWSIVNDLIELMLFQTQLSTKGTISSVSAMNRFHSRQMTEAISAMFNMLLDQKGEDLVEYSERQLRVMDLIVNAYPKAIRDIHSEYGFHFDKGGYEKIAETDRFELYQVLPMDPGTEVRENGKPILIIPPFVLGPNVLAFLPGENRSYTHAFANQGIPTYIRIVKNIEDNPAVQLMTGEDDILDTQLFAEELVRRHGNAVTLNGFCQGGYMAVLGLLSGELDGLVDALITCVAPLDGSRSKGLIEYINHLPYRFRSLGYALKTLPNGNRVVDGKVMSWVYKLKSMETEAPFTSFYRDLAMMDLGPGKMPKISKTAAAVNHWLTYDRTDLPLDITRLSFDSYMSSVSPDGTLPVRLFGRSLNFKRIKEKGIKWLICIAEKDDLVDREASLAPLDFVDAEVAVFPKGHASIATSWSLPTSECALHMNFETKSARAHGTSRGPVRFQLDLEELQEARRILIPALFMKRQQEIGHKKQIAGAARPRSEEMVQQTE